MSFWRIVGAGSVPEADGMRDEAELAQIPEDLRWGESSSEIRLPYIFGRRIVVNDIF